MTESHECKNCENFDLSTNMCLQHNEMGYDCDKHCLHIGCKDWVQCLGFVPDADEDLSIQLTAQSIQNMLDERLIRNLKCKAYLFDKITDIINSTDSQWDCDVKSAYMEIEKIVKGTNKS